MLKEVVSEYLQRFSGSFTESIYNAKGYEDYNYMRRCCDYLQCDKKALTQSRTLPAGLRNIGNTCYLNTILQLLFHINYLREKIATSENLPSKLLKKLQFLFGVLSVGKMPFADPTQVFEQLRAGNPDVFAPGVQNDFHQVFTLLLDAIGQAYKTTSPEDARYIKKILLGKILTKIDYLDGNINKNSEFNIINLEASLGSFAKAFEKWKNYSIPDFTTPNGKVVTAEAENVFLQTPALMVFFINRVAFKNGKLEKDSSPFAFEDSILVSKAYQSEKTFTVKNFEVQKEKEVIEEKKQLTDWIQKAEHQRQTIKDTLKYLKAKEAPLLTQPSVQNSLGEEGRLKTIEYLRQEDLALETRINAVKTQIKQIQKRLNQLLEDENCERYVLWGAMIHEGTSAVFGHYKLCLILGDQWYEYNDKHVTLINREVVDGYRDRGQICCLLYRRPRLMCNSKKSPIPLHLKNAVSQFQRQFKKDIDKARILQVLYQETESISILMEHEAASYPEQKYQFFFKPVHYALEQKFDHDICKGILLQEQLRSQSFLLTLKDRLIQKVQNQDIPFKNFGIPQQYFNVKDAFCNFLNKEITPFTVGQAYDELSKQKLTINTEKAKKLLREMIQVIILKGLYYLKVLSDYDCSTQITLLSEGLERLLSTKEQCQFTLVCISIKASMTLGKGKSEFPVKSKLPLRIEEYSGYFKQHFKFWINQRNRIHAIDETNFMEGAPALFRNR